MPLQELPRLLDPCSVRLRYGFLTKGFAWLLPVIECPVCCSGEMPGASQVIWLRWKGGAVCLELLGASLLFVHAAADY